MLQLIRPIINNLFKLEMEGLEKIDFSKPTILMPNHGSLWDAILLAARLPEEVCFVVNTEIAEKYAPIVQFRKHIPVDPLNPYSVRSMIKVIKSGTPLVIFPEGRITVTGGLMKIYDGMGYLGVKTEANIYPITITGLERSTLSYLNDKWRTKMFPKVRIQIGDPFTITPHPHLSLREQKKAASEEILQRMQESLFQARMPKDANLFNQLIEASKENGEKMTIVESPGFIRKVKKLPDGTSKEIEIPVTERMNYQTLLTGSHIFANKLETLLEKEKNVGVLLPSSIGHVVALFALFKIGKTPAILNFSVGGQTLVDCCETASIQTVLTSKRFIEKGKLEHLVEALKGKVRLVYLEDVKNTVSLSEKLKGVFKQRIGETSQYSGGEVIIFTSGSESKPKGVVLTHENLMANVQQARSIIDITSRDKVLNVLPMFHSFGLTAGTFLPLLVGVPVYLYPSPLHYKVIPELAYDKNATILFGTSTFLAAYGKFAHPYDFRSMRYVFAGAEKLKEEVRTLWMEKFGIRVFEGYGTTEASPVVSLNTPLFHQKGSVGRLLPGMEYQLEEIEGITNGKKLLIKGPNIMKGYLIHGEKELKSTSDWYDTGDIVEVDAKGFIHIKGRAKRFAKIAGEMVPLNLVEEIAMECYKDANVAVVNVPDDRKGEKLILYVTNPDYKIHPLRDYMKEKNYSPLFLPSKIKVVDKLPLLGSGKTDYVTLKKQGEME